MKVLTVIEKYLLLLGIFIIPLAFLPVFLSPFEPVKLTVFCLVLALIVVLYSIKTMGKGSFKFFSSQLDLPVLLLALAYLISAILRTPNKMEAFFIPGSTTLILALTVFFFIVKSFNAEKKALISTLTVSAVLIAVIALLSFAGVFTKIPQLPAFIKNATFSPLGSKLAEAIFLATLFPLGISLAWQEKQVVKKIFWLVCLALLTLSLALGVYHLLPGKQSSPKLPAFSASWIVAVDTLKASPVLGIGPGNYLTAFNRFRPLDFNSSPDWRLRFTSANNFVLTLITETGLLGLAALAILFLQIAKILKSPADWGLTASLVLNLIFLFIFPAGLVQLIAFVLVLALLAKPKEVNFQVPVLATGEKSLTTKLPVMTVTVPVILAVIAFGYFASRALAAEYTYKKSIDVLAKNDGKAAYDLMIKAINVNPRVDRYHSSYGQVNLALARALAQKKDLTDAEKQTVSQLVQQAIREGKSAVALNLQRAGNWESLANIYRSIMPLAQGADNFTIQTLTQAIALDPINTDLRITLGGVYYALGRYDEAIEAFKLAVLTKPDWANSHYNLAIAYKQKGEIKKATEEINIVLSLVGKDTADYETAKKELEKLESLTAPLPAEKPVIRPPLELPTDATPPVPSPTPTAR